MTAMQHLEKWDRRFLEVAKLVSTWSKDPSTGVGAVLVRDRKIVGTGYNGFPAGVADTLTRLHDRPTKYAFTVHAEVNAILQAGHRARGATLYVYPSFAIPPICNECAKVAIQAGVAGIVGFDPDPTEGRTGRWAESIAQSAEMFSEAFLFSRSYPE